MKAKTSLAIGLLLFTPGAFWMVACSSDSGSGTDSGTGMDATVDDTGADTGTMMDTGMMMDTGSGNDSGGGPNCADAGSAQACRACCNNAHKTGLQTFNNALGTCVCTGNKCQACANFCDGGNSNQQCNTCAAATLSPDGGACLGPVGQACQNNPDCTAWIQCSNACP